MTNPLTLESRVRVSDDVLFQDLDGEAVLLNLKSGVYFGLDPVGTRIWRLLEEHELLRDVAEAIFEEYEVTTERATRDLLELVTQMRRQGLVTAHGHTG